MPRKALPLRYFQISLLLVVGLALVVRPAAHHSRGAHYDESRTVTLHGKITRVEWQNPHVFFHIDAVAADTGAKQWAVEFTGPNMLYRAGWRRDTLKPGDVVTFVAFPARTGSPAAYMQTVTFADGRVFRGTPEGLPRLEPPRRGGRNH